MGSGELIADQTITEPGVGRAHSVGSTTMAW